MFILKLALLWFKKKYTICLTANITTGKGVWKSIIWSHLRIFFRGADSFIFRTSGTFTERVLTLSRSWVLSPAGCTYPLRTLEKLWLVQGPFVGSTPEYDKRSQQLDSLGVVGEALLPDTARVQPTFKRQKGFLYNTFLIARRVSVLTLTLNSPPPITIIGQCPPQLPWGRAHNLALLYWGLPQTRPLPRCVNRCTMRWRWRS